MTVDVDLPPGYQVQWEADVVLRDGSVGHLRPILPSDVEGIHAFHARQSAESIYLRFFAPLRLQAEVRLPAFKQRLVPYLNGEVTWVAADVTVDEQARQQYYRAYVLLDRDQLARLPGVFLAPGMPVEAHVQVGQRSFFRYLTQPIRDSLSRAFKEQ